MAADKEEKAQAAAERIKQAALSAAKGLSRAQAERAAAAAARNVNAYGQKEEGPSRWQERKEAKRQMYLMSTEKAVKLGERKDLKTSATSTAGPACQCQKCFQPGHWTYECKNERVYMSRPSRSQILRNPKLKMIAPVSFEGNPDYEREKEKEHGEKSQRKEKGKKNGKKSRRKHRSRSNSEDSSEASVFDSDSESSATGSAYSSDESSSSYSSSDSEDRRRRKKRQRKRRHQKYSSSSSDYSDSESVSDSESDERPSRRKTRRHNRKH